MRPNLVAVLLVVLLSACDRRDASASRGMALAEALGGSDEGFARVLGPREFRFPADHGPHPEFRTEWWYFTGNVADERGERYGFHFTLFRTGLAAAPPPRTSRFAGAQVWMAHFALTDGARATMVQHERFARDAMGLGHAQVDPLVVAVDGWRLEGRGGLGEERTPSFALRARAGDDALDLVLDAAKPLVLQGEDGFSRKGAAEGAASYYYAATRLAVRGSLEIAGRRVTVDGLAWLDREWSTSVLGPEQVGWDWFALQLDDGTDLMAYAMRTRDGGVDPTSHGAWIAPDGAKAHLAQHDYAIAPTATWTSPHTGATYPAGWRITARHPVDGAELDLTVMPLVADQELQLAVTYWEGAVTITGTRDGAPISGRGYAELTGYRR